MGRNMNERPDLLTSRLSDDTLWGLSYAQPDVTYRPVPHSDTDASSSAQPVWRVRFDLVFAPNRRLGMDVNDEVVLGRGKEGPGFVSLSPFDADSLGVSRRHVMLRPTDTKLYILDLGSTNGTFCNGHSIGVNTPYSLSNGDLLALGELEFIVRIVKRPKGRAPAIHTEADLADALIPVARAITSQLELSEVFKQALEMTMSLTSADEVSVWLVDEQTGELFLEVEQGMEDEQVRPMRLPVVDTLAGKVIETGKPLLASRQSEAEQIKVKTGYLVESVIYVPLTLGGVTFGVLSAAHRQAGRRFSSHDGKLIAAIADYAAIAVQNSRLYQATDHALLRRTKTVAALDYALSYDLKRLLNSIIGYAGLLQSYNPLEEEVSQTASSIIELGNKMAYLVDQMIEIASLSNASHAAFTTCDLVEAVSQTVNDLQSSARARSVTLDFKVLGLPYTLYGDAARLHRSVVNLVSNAIRCSPAGALVPVALIFGDNGVIIRVHDAGPPIPEEDLPYVFEHYLRGGCLADDDPCSVGLSLAFIWAVVEAHRGTVTAHNADDGGVEFIITLPATLRLSE